jgi:hypothetical protein
MSEATQTSMTQAAIELTSDMLHHGIALGSGIQLPWSLAKIPLLVPVLNQLNDIHVLSPFYLRSFLILSDLLSESPSDMFLSSFSAKYFYIFFLFPHACCMSILSILLIIFNIEFKLWSVSICSFLHLILLSLLSCRYPPQHSILSHSLNSAVNTSIGD